MNATTCDIAIVGGGMAGSSLALLLAQRLPALRITLLEAFAVNGASPLPSYDDRSSALSLGSCRIFRSLGLWEALQPHLCAIRRVHVSDRGHPAGAVLDATQMPSLNGELGYVIENRHLGNVLLTALRNTSSITLRDQTKVERIALSTDGAQLQLHRGETLSCRLAVIADGADSPLREQLGIAIDRKPYHQAAVIANVSTSAFHEHIAYERFTDSGPMALLPLQDFDNEHRCALVWTIEESRMESTRTMNDEQFLEEIQKRFGQRLGFFIRAGKRTLYPLSLLRAKEQVRRRVVLMGNAAHSMHPVAGQGFNLSLRDCQALASVLCTAQQSGEDIGELSVLQRYLAQQEADQDKTIGASHLLTLLFSSAELPSAVARNSGLLGLNFLPGLRNWFARHAMGIAGQGIAERDVRRP